MLIEQIMDRDVDNCYKALHSDEQLIEIDDTFYSLLSECPEHIHFDMERNVSKYMARVTRIAYLQGIIDFAKLFIVLKEDAHEILRKYEDNIESQK